MEAAARTENQRIVVAHGLLLAAIVLVVATLHFVFLSGEHLIYPLCLGLTALLAWSLWSWKAVSGQVVDPYGLFLLAAFLFNAGHALLEVVGANPTGVLDNRFSVETTIATLTFTLVALAAFHLGGLLAASSGRSWAVTHPRVEPAPSDLRLVGWTMLAVAFLPAVLVLHHALTVTMDAGYFALFGADVPVGIEATPRVLASFLVPASLFLLAGSRDRLVHRWVSGFVIAGYCGTMLVVGSRAPAVMSLVAYAWLWNRAIRRIPRSVLLAGACAILFLLPLVRTVRGDFGADRFLFPHLREAFLTIESPALGTVREMGGTMKTVSHTLELVPDLRPFDLGASYGYAFLTVLPNVFWDVHPTIAHGLGGTWLTNTVDPVLARFGGGLGYSFLAEAYLNFGWLAPIAVAGIGFLFARFVLWATTSHSLARLAGLASFLSSFLFFARSESGAILRPLFWYSLIPYLSCLAVAQVRSRLAAQRSVRTSVLGSR